MIHEIPSSVILTGIILKFDSLEVNILFIFILKIKRKTYVSINS